MSKNRCFKKTKILLLTALLVLNLAACGKSEQSESETEATADQKVETNEQNIELTPVENAERTVYVNADAKGTVQQVTVETLMRDEEGEEFRYKEETDEEIPVDISVSYFLDGESIEPEDLAGKSGNVRIRFDYENKTGENDKTPVPFTVITALVLPTDVFSNIEVTNGKTVSMEGQNMVVGFALPGISQYLGLNSYEPTEEIEIPEYVEVTAEAEEFELEFTTTVMMTGIFENLEEENLGDIDEMTDSMKELGDASEELVKGTKELYAGMKEFDGYLEDLSEGVDAVSKGAEAVNSGLESLSEQSEALVEGAKTLQSGVNVLNESLSNAPAVAAEENQELINMMREMGLSEEQMEQLLEKITAQTNAQIEGTLSQIKTGVENLQAGSQGLLEGAVAYTQGVEAISEGAAELSAGSNELAKAGKELSSGFSDVIDGVEELKDGFAQFDEEAISELEKLAGNELAEIIAKIRKLKEADGSWSGFSRDTETESSVRIILETESI